MVVTENLLSLHLSCPSVPVIENFKVPICPSVPVTGISKSVFVPVTKGSRMTSLHMSQYFPVSQYFPEYYQHCLIRHLQISLWEMIRQLLSQCLFWERTHFPSISHYSQRFSKYYHQTYWECFNWAMFRKSYSPIDDQTVSCSMTLQPYGQIDMIQLHWESIFLSYQCVTTVFARWSSRTVWNITYLSKCLFNPLMTSDEYI